MTACGFRWWIRIQRKSSYKPYLPTLPHGSSLTAQVWGQGKKAERKSHEPYGPPLCPRQLSSVDGGQDRNCEINLSKALWVRQMIFFLRKWAITWGEENLRWYWKAKKMSKQSKELAARLQSREHQGSESWQGRSMWWHNRQNFPKLIKDINSLTQKLNESQAG